MGTSIEGLSVVDDRVLIDWLPIKQWMDSHGITPAREVYTEDRDGERCGCILTVLAMRTGASWERIFDAVSRRKEIDRATGLTELQGNSLICGWDGQVDVDAAALPELAAIGRAAWRQATLKG